MFSYSFGLDAQMTDAAYPAYIKETLPASKLGYGTNNRYPQFPPLMQDGRSLMSSWTPESVVDRQYWQDNAAQFRGAGMSPNWMYRRHLQKHGLDVIAQNFRETANDTGFSAAALAQAQGQAPASSTPQNRNIPYMFTSLNDAASSETVPGYESSDLKSLYLTREQLQARKSAPTIQ